MGKKVFLFSLFAFLAAGFWFGGVSLAATVECTAWNFVAKIWDEKCYKTLADAITDVTDGGTVTLFDKVAIETTQVITKDLIINLNGHNITATNARALWIKKGDVEIKGSGSISANGDGLGASSSVIRVGDGGKNDTILNKAKLTIGENVTVSSAKSYGITVFGVNDTDNDKTTSDIELVVNGKVKVTGTTAEAAISGNGNSWNSATKITIGSNAEVISDKTAIYHPWKGILIVNGKVEWAWGIEIKSGEAIINNGATVTATADSQGHNANNDGTSTAGYAIAAVSNLGYVGDPKVTINGGTVTGKIDTLEDSGENNGDIDVSWWTFDSELDPEYISTTADKDDITVNLWDNAVAKVWNIEFSTLENAIAAANSNDIVEILKDKDWWYTLPSTINAKSIKKAEGVTNEVILNIDWSSTSIGQKIITLWNDITFEWVTLNFKSTDDWKHLDESHKVTMKNCDIKWVLYIWWDTDFDHCKFYWQDLYQIHINYWNVNFDTCIFTNNVSRHINIAWWWDATYKINFKDSTFSNTVGAASKAAVMIHELWNQSQYSATNNPSYYRGIPENKLIDINGTKYIPWKWEVTFENTNVTDGSIFSDKYIWNNQLFGIDTIYSSDNNGYIDPKEPRDDDLNGIILGSDSWGEVKVKLDWSQVYTTPIKNISQWTVTFDWKNALIVNNWEKAVKPTDPADQGCSKHFVEWRLNGTTYDFNTTVTSDLALTSYWTSTCSSGGGGGSSKTYSCKNLPDNAVKNNSTSPKSDTDYSYSTDTTKVCTFQCKSGYTWNSKDAKCEKSDANTNDENKVDETNNENNNNEWNNNGDNNNGWSNYGSSSTDKGFSQEFKDAYAFAHENGITTMGSIEEADMYGPLTRIAMAKMLSQYAINVLGKTPDTSKVVPNFPDVDAQLDADYNNWVTLAYQLGIMGIGIEKFRPFDLVTRAEFGTALSRMLYGTADGEGADWYSTHLAKLMNEKIITNDNPQLQELRGYVMIMLMRSAQ